MKFVKRERPSVVDREIEALHREAAQYAALGMTDRLRLVNAELRARGADPVHDAPEAKQTRTSGAAASRKKAKP